MSQFQFVWYGQAIVMLVVVGGMIVVLIRVVRWSLRNSTHRSAALEHGPLIAAAALVVGIGNVMTTYATGANLPEVRDAGGIMVRGTLLLAVLYMLAWGPPRQRD